MNKISKLLKPKVIEVALQEESARHYNPYQIPPDIDLALRHLQATSVGKATTGTVSELCECCDNPVSIRPFGIFSNVKKFARYGIAYTVLFYYIAFMAFMGFVIFFISGVPFIYYVPNALDCIFSECKGNNFVANYSKSSFVLHLLGLACILIFIGSKVGFIFVLSRWENKLDKQLLKPNDFAMCVKGLPKESTTEEIKAKIYSIVPDSNYTIVDVNKIYDIEFFSKMVDLRLKKERKYFKLLKSENPDPRKLGILENEYSQLTNQVNQIINDIENEPKFEFSGSAFVIFEFEEQMKKVLELSKRRSFKTKLGGSIKIHRASLPTNIIWDNYSLTNTEKMIRRLFSLFIAFALMGVTFELLILVKKLENDASKENKGYLNLISTSLSVVIVFLINKSLAFSLSKTVEFERRPTFSDLEISKIRNQSTAQFLNTAFIILIANFIQNGQVLLIGKQQVLPTIVSLMFVGIAVELFLFVFDFGYFFKWLRRRRLINSLKKNPGEVRLFQYEAQKIFENEPFALFQPFTELFTSVAIAFFYFPIFPFGVAITAVRLCFMYFINKYRFIRRSRVSIEYEFEFSRKIIKFTDVIIFYFCAGYITFDWILTESFSWITLIILLVGILQLFFLNTKFIFRSKGGKTEFSKVPYNIAQRDFLSDYEKENPITRLRRYKILIQEKAISPVGIEKTKEKEIFGNVISKLKEGFFGVDFPLIQNIFVSTAKRSQSESSTVAKKGLFQSHFENGEVKESVATSKRALFDKMSEIIFEEENEKDGYKKMNDEEMKEHQLIDKK